MVYSAAVQATSTIHVTYIIYTLVIVHTLYKCIQYTSTTIIIYEWWESTVVGVGGAGRDESRRFRHHIILRPIPLPLRHPAKRASPEWYFMYKPSEYARYLFITAPLRRVLYTAHATRAYTPTLLMTVENRRRRRVRKHATRIYIYIIMYILLYSNIILVVVVVHATLL